MKTLEPLDYLNIAATFMGNGEYELARAVAQCGLAKLDEPEDAPKRKPIAEDTEVLFVGGVKFGEAVKRAITKANGSEPEDIPGREECDIPDCLACAVQKAEDRLTVVEGDIYDIYVRLKQVSMNIADLVKAK